MTLFDIIALAIALLVIVFGLFAGAIRRTPLSVPMLALASGFALSRTPWAVPPAEPVAERLLYEIASLSLATGLFGSALKLPKWEVFRRWRGLLVLLGLVIPLMWVTGAALARASLGLPLGVALLVGACLAPTDPILARSVMLGKIAERNVPRRVRLLILTESSVNDGTAFPFVTLAIGLLASTSFSPVGWFVLNVGWAVLGAAVLGLALGWAGGRLERWAVRSSDTSDSFTVSLPLALAVASLLLIRAAGVDGILGVFFAGTAFKAFGVEGRTEQQRDVQGLVDDFFAVAVFFLLGLTLPVEAWRGLGWPLLAFVAALLVVRRLPWMLLLRRLVPEFRTGTEAAFAGWFGPIGVSAVFYASLALRAADLPVVWPTVTAVVAASTLVHGATGTPLTVLLGSALRERPGRPAPSAPRPRWVASPSAEQKEPKMADVPMDDVNELWRQTKDRSWDGLLDTLKKHENVSGGISNKLVHEMEGSVTDLGKSGKPFPDSAGALKQTLDRELAGKS